MALDELGGLGASIDVGVDQGKESNEGVSEAEIASVEKNQKKAKQVGGFIAKKKKQNSKLSVFFTHVLQHINNEKTFTHINKLFFTGHGSNAKIKSELHMLILVGFFVPFFPDDAKQTGVYPPFKDLYHFNGRPTLHEYTAYLKTLSTTYHDNIPLDKAQLLHLVIAILNEFDVISRNSMTKEDYHAFVHDLSLELIGQAPNIESK